MYSSDLSSERAGLRRATLRYTRCVFQRDIQSKVWSTVLNWKDKMVHLNDILQPIQVRKNLGQES